MGKEEICNMDCLHCVHRLHQRAADDAAGKILLAAQGQAFG